MAQSSKSVVEAFFRALGSGNAQAMAGLVTQDIVAVAHGTSVASGTRDYEGVIAALELLRQTTTDGITFEIISMTEEEDRISCEVQGSSTLVTGQPYNNRYHFLFRLKAGRICRIDEYFDTKLVDEVMGPMFESQ